jgi:Protein of unknown function (DUF1257)
MSHLVTVQTQIRDPVAIASACRRLGLAEPIHGTAQLYSGQATGLILRLPGWTFPVVIGTDTGTVNYDNYGGSWGDQAQLDSFMQAYAVEKARLEARKKGFTVSEQTLEDGSIRLQIAEGF